MNKAQKRFYGAALTLSTVASVIAPVAVSAATVSYEDAKAKVDALKATPVFSLYNKAYEAAMALENKDQQAVLLSELAPYWTKVATPYVTGTLAKLESLAKDKNLKDYNEILAEIQANTDTAEAVNKEYLLGQLADWGSSGSLYGDSEKAAIDAINAAWGDKTPAKIDAAKEAVAKVTNAKSVEWLNAQIAEVQSKMDTTVTSVKAVGAKKLEVKFNKAVDDTKAVITVKKGSITASVATKTFSTNKDSVVLELAGKLTEGDYTVSVTGLGDVALTGTVSVVDEKVAKIDILSDNAIATTGDNYNVDKVTANFKVFNQYGEDVTKTSTVIATFGIAGTPDYNYTDGKVSVDTSAQSNKPKIGDKFTLVIINAETGVSATKTLTISNAANISALEATLYNADNEALTEDSDAVDYSLIITAKDQYGNLITDAQTLIDGLVVNVSNANVAGVVSTTNNGITKPTVRKVLINGEYKLVVDLKYPTTPGDVFKEGTSVITFISRSTGVSTSFTAEVKPGVRANKVTLSQPDLAVSGEAVRIPFTATDVDGNPVTDIKVLNGDLGVNVSLDGDSKTAGNEYNFVKDNSGNIFLEIYPTASVDKVNLTVGVTPKKWTSSASVANLVLNLKEAAVPTAIIGLDSDAPVNLIKGEKVFLAASNLQVQDQYGRTMTDADLKAKLISGQYKIKVTPTTGDTLLTFANSNQVIGFSGDGTESKINYTASEAGTTQLTFKLYQSDLTTGVKNNVEWTTQARSVELTSIKSYSVGTLADMFDSTTGNISAFNQDVTVYGVLADGTKVVLPAYAADGSTGKYYNVATGSSIMSTAPKSIDLTSADSRKVSLKVTNSNPDFFEDDVKTKTYPVQFIINRTGEVIAREVKVSTVKPVLAQVNFNDDVTYIDGTITNGIDTGSITNLTVGDGVVNLTDIINVKLLKLKDQYGKEITVDSATKLVPTSGVINNTANWDTALSAVTFSNRENANGESLTANANGTLGASLTGVDAGDSFTITFTFTNGMSASIRVIAKN